MWRDIPDNPETYEGKLWQRTCELAVMKLLGDSFNDCHNCEPDGGHTSKLDSVIWVAYRKAKRQIIKMKRKR